MLSSVFPVRQMRARPLACIGIAFLLGMLFYSALSLKPLPLLLASIVLCIAGFCLRKRFRILLSCGILLLAFGLGALRLDAALSAKPRVSSFSGETVTGIVTDDPLYRDDGRIVCSLKITQPISCNVKLYLRSTEQPLEGIAYGQTLQLTGKLWEGDWPTNPHQTNARYALFASGYDGRMTAALEDTKVLGVRHSIWDFPHDARTFLSARIDELFPKSSALAKAFILGDRSNLSEDVREDFSNSGIAHLICISGMHISVLSTAILWLLNRRLPMRYAAPITIVLVFLYGALIDFPVSFIRAFIMFTVLSFAPICGRKADSITRLVLAMTAMLIMQPLWVFNTGFALSFAASGGIMLCEPPLEELFCVPAFQSKNRFFSLAGKILSMLCVTLAAQLSTLPIVLACYGAQSPLSIAANLIAVPLAMLAYPIALATVLLSIPLHTIAVLIAPIADNLFYPLLVLARVFSSLGSVKLRLPAYPFALTLLHFALLLAASPLSALPAKLRKFLLPAGVTCCALISVGIALLCATPFSVTFFDAGQADAAMLQLKGRTYCIDVGDEYSPINDALASVQTVDAVFLTHPHDDHAGALGKLLSRVRPKAIYVPVGWFDAPDMSSSIAEAMEAAKEENIPILPLLPGDTFELRGGLTIRVEDTGHTSSNDNDLFLLLRAEYRGKSFLFTGDMEANDEPEEIAPCDVLKVAHHGAKTSTSEGFLSQTQPEVAVLSVGQNSYGHPHPDVVARINAVNSTIYRTDADGAIRMTLDRSGQIQIKTYKDRTEG